MKTKRQLAGCILATFCLLGLAGCTSKNSSTLANEMTFSLNGISQVTISYDEEPITFYEGEGNNLIIKEYMTENKSSYYAKVEQTAESIKISEGSKPFFKDGFSRWIEVYLPTSYQQSLTVITTDGNIDCSALVLTLDALRIDSTAGSVKLGTQAARSIHLSTTSGALDAERLAADMLRIETTSGSFSCHSLNGTVTYTTTSGDAVIQAATGCGSYQASNSGKLDVTYTEVSGDVSFYNKNDAVSVVLPADLEFILEATTKNGSVHTNFDAALSVNGRTTSGTVGQNPSVTVKVETNNGDIEVTQ